MNWDYIHEIRRIYMKREIHKYEIRSKYIKRDLHTWKET